jgi:predicted PhzF superfamily epimerase YddE/YHI9
LAPDLVTGGAHCALTPFWAARLGETMLRARQAPPRGGELTCHDRGDRVGVWYLEGEIRW